MGLRKCFVSWNVSRQTMVQNDLKTKKEKSQRHEKCYIAFIRRNNDYNEPTRLDVAKLFVKLYFKIIPVLLCNIANRLVNENSISFNAIFLHLFFFSRNNVPAKISNISYNKFLWNFFCVPYPQTVSYAFGSNIWKKHFHTLISQITPSFLSVACW